MKVVSAGAALAGFGIVALVARGAETGDPGAPASSSSLGLSDRISGEAERGGSFFQSGSVEPAQPMSPPRASTQTS